MRIGFFTDSYYPNINGITLIIEAMRSSLCELDHEVYVFAPKPLNKKDQKIHDKLYVKRVPAINDMLFHDQSTSVFFPTTQYLRVKRLELDVIIIFTPAQIGLLGSYCALKLDIPLVSYYATDLVEYIERYPFAILGVLALMSTTPLALRMNTRDILRLIRISIPATRSDELWRKKIVKEMLKDFHARCSQVIVPSYKSELQMQSWGVKTPIDIVPSGVNPPADLHTISGQGFRHKYKIPTCIPVIMYLGRVAKEKNIDTLIEAMNEVLEAVPEAFLVIVGNFDYRKTLESKVARMNLSGSVIFTGKVSIDDRWQAFKAADIFVFPSVTDTQALVINEAALCGLPIVWCDKDVNGVLLDGQSGLLCENTANSFAKTIIKLLNDKALMVRLGQSARDRATKMTEYSQAKKFSEVLSGLVK